MKNAANGDVTTVMQYVNTHAEICFSRLENRKLLHNHGIPGFSMGLHFALSALLVSILFSVNLSNSYCGQYREHTRLDQIKMMFLFT